MMMDQVDDDHGHWMVYWLLTLHHHHHGSQAWTKCLVNMMQQHTNIYIQIIIGLGQPTNQRNHHHHGDC